MTLWQAAALMLGGGTGACLRYSCGLAFRSQTAFPLATLLVNIAGSGCAGLLLAVTLMAPGGGHFDTFWRVPLVDGLLGGLTTFSTFALETVTLLTHGDLAKATLNTVANAALGLLAAAGGYALALHALRAS